MASAGKLISVEFEVFGRVQGVFFRKFTQETAQKYGLVGWVKNTPDGTVKGIVQGPQGKVKTMKEWLSVTGSPKSTIEKCEFINERPISKCEFPEFVVDRKKKKKLQP